ncbi:MAG: hypothetical protein IJJ00_00510 [Erysipelotrichaceae bacterium]|nr:hypothetical protein [Erysipelotrichaceae bacterium]
MADRKVKEERKNLIEAMNKKEVDTSIRDIKKRIKEINEFIAKKERSKSEIGTAQEKRISKLDAAHKKDLSALELEKRALENELASLEAEAESYRQSEKAKLDEVAARKTALKEKHKKVVNEEIEKEKKKHKKTVGSYNSQLDELRQTKKKQTDSFNESAEKLEGSYKKVEKDLSDKKMALKNKKEKLEKDAKAQLNALEMEETDLVLANQEELDRFIEDSDAEVKKLTEEEELLLNQKKVELNALYHKLDEANQKKDLTLDDYDKTVQRLENEYRDLSDKYDSERNSLTERNESLRREIELRREENERQRNEASLQYKQSLADLNDLVKTYGDDEALSAATLKRALEEKDEEYKKKYSELVDYLDEQYVHEKLNQEKEVEDLKYRLELEQEQLKNRNSYLKERYDNREAEYKRVNESLIEDNNELENRITELENYYSTKINDFKNKLISIRNSHDEEITSKKIELERRLEEVKASLIPYKEKIAAEKEDVTRQIQVIDGDILKAKEELNEYISNAKVKEQALSDKHQNFIAEVLNRKDQIDAARAQLEEEIAVDVAKRNGLLAEVDERREAINAEHEVKLNEIRSAHDIEMEELRSKHEELLAQAKAAHENLLVELAKQQDEVKKGLEEEGLARKNSFDEARASLLKATQDLDDDNEARINKIHAQKSELLNHIQILKDNYDSELAQYNSDKEQLDSYRNDTINEMERNFRAEVEEINADTTPVEELEQVKNIFNKRTLEYENVLKDAADQRSAIDKEINDYIDVSNQEKAAVEEQLAQASKAYDDKAKAADEEYRSFEKELGDKQAALAAFNDSLNQQLADLKAKNESDLNELVSKQNSEYEELNNSYREKEESIQNIYDQEIRFRTDELEAKKADYSNHLEDLKRRKSKNEYDYDNRYSSEVSKTESLQKELEDLNAELVSKRVIWNNEIEARKIEINQELTDIENSRSSIISENRKAFDEKVQAMKTRIGELRGEILKLEEDTHAKRNELEAYKDAKTTEFDNLKIRTNEYLNEINRKLKELATKEMDLEDMHNSRVMEIKKQIARSVSEYENLERTLPFMLKKEEEVGSDELIAMAAEFKEKIDSLDKTHKDILDSLAVKKDAVLAKIGEELESVMYKDGSLETNYVKDFEELSAAYDRLFSMEKGKQEALLKEISGLSGQYRDEYERYQAEASKYNVEAKYDAALNARERELDYLGERKNSVLNELDGLISTFNMIDSEITNRKEQLLNIFNSKVKQIDDYYTKAVEDNRAQYRVVDVMKDDVSNIFKKKVS